MRSNNNTIIVYLLFSTRECIFSVKELSKLFVGNGLKNRFVAGPDHMQSVFVLIMTQSSHTKSSRKTTRKFRCNSLMNS